MKTSFQKTLLLLFIFFALIPTILLILTGYYISTESFNSQNDTDNEYIYKLIDYYNNTLFEQLEIALNSYPDNKIISSSFDFLVRNDSLMFIETRFSRYPYEEFKDIIILNSNQKEYGFFQYQNRYWQYYKLVKNDSDVLIGGIAHDISYSFSSKNSAIEYKFINSKNFTDKIS